MAITRPMFIVVFIFVVGVISSINVVSGRLDLRAFEDDDVPYVFDCRRGRCGRLPTSHHRQSHGSRGLDRFDDVDDMVDEASAKSFGGSDYDYDDDKAVGRFRAINDDRGIMTFPYCSTMSTNECRSLLQRLERFRLRQLRRATKRNVVVTGVDGTVVRLLGRRRRSAQEVGTGNEKAAEATKVRATRSSNGHGTSEAQNRLLDQYREWRKANGYGRNYARWGRGIPSTDQKDRTAHQHSGNASKDKDSLMTPINNTTNDVDVHRRTSRSVVVEIEGDEDIPETERDMLDTYLAWRETHGYGTLSGRWG